MIVCPAHVKADVGVSWTNEEYAAAAAAAAAAVWGRAPVSTVDLENSKLKVSLDA